MLNFEHVMNEEKDIKDQGHLLIFFHHGAAQL